MNGLDEFAHDTTWNPVTKYVSSVYAGLGADAPAWHGTYRENEDPELIAHFVIEGEPETKSRPRFSRYGRHVYTPERTANAEAHIAARFRQSRPGYLPRTVGNYGVAVVFFCATRQRRDVDNMLKLILDGLNGIAWVDDVQVSEVTGRVVRWAEEPRTDVIIYRTPTQGPPLRPCEQCGKGFDYSRNKKGRFCSPACASAHRRETRECVICGTEFTLPQSISARVKAAPTCSTECRAKSVQKGAGTRSAGSCATCGEPTSKAKYTNCAPCSARLRAKSTRTEAR